jgi:Cullin family
MDRTFVKSFNKTPVYAHGMEIWRDEIVHYQDVGGRLLEIFLEQVAAERSGDIVDRGTLAEVTKMMLELGKPVYIQDLQEPFLAKSKEFFQCAPCAFCARCMHSGLPQGTSGHMARGGRCCCAEIGECNM